MYNITINQLLEENKMAIIKCPKCLKEISDNAASCPECGTILQKNESICKECGSELKNEYSYCLNCGCPVDFSNNEQSNTLQNEIKNTDPAKKSKRKRYLIIVSVVLVIAILTSGILLKKQMTVNYKEKLSSISLLMIEGAANAENIGNLIHNVWYNTIYEKHDSQTDKYTLDSSGWKFNDDFNDSLSNLFNDNTYSEQIESLKNNQNSVVSMMKELTDPPKEYQEAYTVLKEYYDAYLEFTNLIINPTGSLSTFTNNFHNADSKVVNAYNSMKIYI